MTVADGNDLAAIEPRCSAARAETARPSLILVRTHIGYGSPEQDSFKAHGSPLGVDEVRRPSRNSAGRTEPPSWCPTRRWRTSASALDARRQAQADWETRDGRLCEGVSGTCRGAAAQPRRRAAATDWDADMPVFPADAKGMATRVAGGKVMNAIAPRAAGADRRLGGPRSVDLHRVEGTGRFQSAGRARRGQQGSDGGGWSYAGRNLHFGVREHAMGAIVNGMAAHGGIIPYGATFLIFSDYMRPPIRLAALMGLHVMHVFTHDSIALGEDGPTHQPVEQLAGAARGSRT